MRRLSANYIYRVDNSPLKNGIVEVNDDGEVLRLIDTKGELQESRSLEFYNGIIVPGFINAHCHLELSDMKGVIPEKQGLPKFITTVVEYKKKVRSDAKMSALKLQDHLMKAYGVVAVGDICNTADTIQIKKKSRIHYYNFIEAIGVGSNYKEIFDWNNDIKRQFENNDLDVSIVPHAPYSVSLELLNRIKAEADVKESVLSMHNQESELENKMFYDKSGELYETLRGLGVDYRFWNATGKNSIQSITQSLPQKNNILLVHNTYSDYNDVKLVNETLENAYWCLCPLSNLYIEDKLPDINLFNEFSDKVVLGTDSLASNKRLSILDEMKVIQRQFKDIPFANILRWATLNGAKSLKLENKLGSISKGKKPGLNLISNFDFSEMKLTEKSEVKVLV